MPVTRTCTAKSDRASDLLANSWEAMSFCSHGREPVAMVSLITFATYFAPEDGVTDDPPNLFRFVILLQSMASTGDFGAIDLCESCSAISEMRYRDSFTSDRFPAFRRKSLEMTKDFVFGIV